MPFAPPQPSAAWAHEEARAGLVVVCSQPHEDGHLISGVATAVEDGRCSVVAYEIRVDGEWRTRSARAAGRSKGHRRMPPGGPLLSS